MNYFGLQEPCLFLERFFSSEPGSRLGIWCNTAYEASEIMHWLEQHTDMSIDEDTCKAVRDAYDGIDFDREYSVLSYCEGRKDRFDFYYVGGSHTCGSMAFIEANEFFKIIGETDTSDETYAEKPLKALFGAIA